MIFSNKISVFFRFLLFIAFAVSLAFLDSCSTFKYVTYDKNDTIDEDPEPNYSYTLDPAFQEFTNYMFIGNRIEYFGTYFNTFFNASQSYSDAYDDYEKKVLTHYSERLDSILVSPRLSLDAQDNFNKAIEKASKVIQYHKSSAFMDQAVLLIGKSYYYLGDFLKAERKFNEFTSKLPMSPLNEEAKLYLAKTQLRLNNIEPALAQLNYLISASPNSDIVSESYQALAEYYISQKDFESAIKDYQKSIELSSDKYLKAQLQFLIASIISRTNPPACSEEYQKVLDYSTSYELEYLAKYNSIKYAIIGGGKGDLITAIEKLNVKYKDDTDLLPQIYYLKGFYYDTKKDYKNALIEFQSLMQTFPKSTPSADASCSIAKYYEDVKGDYLNAYRFYKYSLEESSVSHDYYNTFEKSNTLKKYFDLRSVIAGVPINTEYDSVFLHFVSPPGQNEGNKEQNGNPNSNPKNGDEGKSKIGGGHFGYYFSDSTKDKMPRLQNPIDTSSKTGLSQTDSSAEKDKKSVDSVKLRQEKVLDAKFELSELFLYDLHKPDSAENYLNEAFDGTDNPEFKAKILYTKASLYRNENKNEKADEVLKSIIAQYPLSSFANQSRKLLNLPEIDLEVPDASDSLYKYGESKFVNNEYPTALEAFKSICENDTASKYFLRSAYAAGWIFENVLIKPDSAVKYYSKILLSNPNSDISKLVTAKLTIYKQDIQEKEDSSKVRNSLNMPDSLTTDSTKNKTDTSGNRPGEINGELRNNPGDNSGKEQTLDKSSGTDDGKDTNPDMKKEEVPSNEPVKSK